MHQVVVAGLNQRDERSRSLPAPLATSAAAMSDNVFRVFGSPGRWSPALQRGPTPSTSLHVQVGAVIEQEFYDLEMPCSAATHTASRRGWDPRRCVTFRRPFASSAPDGRDVASAASGRHLFPVHSVRINGDSCARPPAAKDVASSSAQAITYKSDPVSCIASSRRLMWDQRPNSLFAPDSSVSSPLSA
jgi:hypothetical protein